MALDLAALDPAPTKVVANLPYGIAATAILRTIEELPASRAGSRWSRRRSASGSPPAPGSGAYGDPVGARPARLRRARARGRSRARVFHPVPNVDSVLVVLERTRAGARARRCARSCRRAFAHRRKALARSLALAPGARRARTCATARARRSSRSATRPTCAPSACRPTDFRALRREALARDRALHRASAPGEDQPLPVPRPDARATAGTSSCRSCSR